jgi:myo-inositol-1(or 4)-monophosphatase
MGGTTRSSARVTLIPMFGEILWSVLLAAKGLARSWLSRQALLATGEGTLISSRNVARLSFEVLVVGSDPHLWRLTSHRRHLSEEMKHNDPSLVSAVVTLVESILGTVNLTPHMVYRPADPTTNVDIVIDEMLYRGLLDLVECGYISEERASRPSARDEFAWVVDPIDGTQNLVAGLPECGPAVGLMHIATKQPQLAVCTVPSLGLSFTASKGNGAYRNGIRLYRTGDYTGKFIIAIEFSAASYRNIQRSNKLVGQLMTDGFTLRQTGSAMYSICRVATGSLYGFVEQGVELWDVIAADLVATEAGCCSWSVPTRLSHAEKGTLDYAVGCSSEALERLVGYLDMS